MPGGVGPGGRARRGVRSDAIRGRPDASRAADAPRGSGRSAAPIRSVSTGRPASTGRVPTAGRTTAGRTTAGRSPAGRTGVARRPAGGAARTRAPQPRRFTGRAAVLGMVLVGLLLAYAYPVRVYLAQQAEIAGLEAQQDEQRRRIAALRDQRDKWNDDEYVKSRARRDLHYFLPGETPLVTFGDPASGGGEPAPGSTDRPHAAAQPWYQKLWTSVGAADHPTAAP